MLARPIPLPFGGEALQGDLRALSACDIITSAAHEIYLLCDLAPFKPIVAQRCLVGNFAYVSLT
jgi:hypothetical protein